MAIISKADVHLIVAIFLGALISVQAWDVARDVPNPSFLKDLFAATPEGTENLSALATGLFDTWVVPFEALSLLLLIALVGGIAIAIKDDGGFP